tara:strand:- start:1727 stop:2359 length:633 start_codon:yes stop_codon:yes gene_type:complete
MSSTKDGIMVVLSSPSGAGKTTLVKKISQQENFVISVSHTTRKPRTNEIDGKDYIFVSDKEFQNLIKNNKFLEYAKVFNNFYGSSKKNVIDNLESGKNVLFDIDWQGTEQLKNHKLNYKLITIFILPPSIKELNDRLMNRDTNDTKNILERMKQFSSDVLKWKQYDYAVINDNLDNCLKEIMDILNSRKKNLEIKYNKLKIIEHIKKLTN